MDKAPSRLNVVVLGSGVGGLSAALGIARHGHAVTVYEREPQLTEFGAGIQIPPNATRILDAWGLKDTVYSLADITQHTTARRYSNGVVIGQLKTDLKGSFGYKKLVIHRGDLQQMLYRAALEAGVQVEFGRRVRWREAGVLESEGDSTLAHADLVVAAEGIRSETRSKMFPDPQFRPQATGECVTRMLLSSEEVKTDPKLSWLVETATNNMWMGPRRHVVAYTIRSTTCLNIALCGPGTAPVGIYNAPAPPAEAQAEYADFDENVRGIISKAKTCHKWVLSEVPPLPQWHDSKSRVVLLGDACHAMLPYAAQGAAMCIEDAAVLATCLAKAQTRADVSARIALYTALRKTRAERVQAHARKNAGVFGLEDGPAQEARDARFRPTLADGEQPAKAFSDSAIIERELSEWLFGYDAIKDAETHLASRL